MKKYEISFSDQVIAAFDTGLPLFSFRLKDDIDVNILKEAVCDALKLHPLYKSKLVFENGLYHYAFNELEPIIFHTKWSDKIEYGVASNNFYPWLVMYDKDEIHFTAAHSLSDGGGASRFMKSFLILYLKKRGVTFPENIDITIEDAERTFELSSEKHIDPNNKALSVPKEKEVLDTPTELYETDISKVSEYNVTVDVADIKAAASASETTSFAVLASMLAIAYEKMLAVNEGVIKVEVPFDLRRFWNSVTDHNFVNMAGLYYDVAKLKGKNIELVETAFRSQLDIYMDKTNQVERFNTEHQMLQMLQANPAMLEQMKKSVTDRLFLPKASIVLTHLGKLGFPDELLREIVDFKITNSIFAGYMMAAVGFICGEKLTLNMVQATKGDIYIEKLNETFAENGISCKCEKVEPHGAIVFKVPS